MNCRHHDFQSCALPTELPRHGGSRYRRTPNIPRTSARHDQCRRPGPRASRPRHRAGSARRCRCAKARSQRQQTEPHMPARGSACARTHGGRDRQRRVPGRKRHTSPGDSRRRATIGSATKGAGRATSGLTTQSTTTCAQSSASTTCHARGAQARTPGRHHGRHGEPDAARGAQRAQRPEDASSQGR